MGSLFQSKQNNAASEEQNSIDRATLEMYQSFMEGYVRRINQATLNVTVGGIRIGLAKYSRLAQINLKSRIMTFSRYAIENVPERGRRYLVIHELAHVKEPGHNKRFWDLVGRFEPDYRQVGRKLEIAFKRNVEKDNTDKKSGDVIVPAQGNTDQLKFFLGSLQGNYKVNASDQAGASGNAGVYAIDDETANPGELESLDCLEDDLLQVEK